MGHAILQHGLIDASATLVVGGGRMIGTVLDIQKGASAKASTELLRTVLEMAILRCWWQKPTEKRGNTRAVPSSSTTGYREEDQ